MVWVKGRHVGLALRDEEKKRKVKKGEIREEDVYTRRQQRRRGRVPKPLS